MLVEVTTSAGKLTCFDPTQIEGFESPDLTSTIIGMKSGGMIRVKMPYGTLKNALTTYHNLVAKNYITNLTKLAENADA